MLGMPALALYLGDVEESTVREIVASGAIPRVRLVPPNGRELRRLLVDRADVDRLIQVWKDPAR